MTSLSRFLLALLAISVCVTSQDVPTFKSGTSVVLVPVIVSSGGHHVAGLTKNDFTVLEDGKPQNVTIFDETTSKPQLEPAKGEPGEVTNGVSTSGATRVTIVVLDLVNTPFEDQVYAKSQLLKYLASNLDPREPTALMALTGKGLLTIQSLTSDPKQLIAMLKALNSQPPQNLRATSGADVGTSEYALRLMSVAGIRGANGEPADPSDPFFRQAAETAEALVIFRNGTANEFEALQTRQKISATLSAFQQIARAYAAVPGRKSLIWATAGIPFEVTASGTLKAPEVFSAGGSTNPLAGGGSIMNSSGALPSLPESTSLLQGSDLSMLTPLYERTMQVMADANIAVYPVDSRGLVAFAAGAERTGINTAVQRQNRELQITAQSSMDSIATATGGHAFYNRNDLDAAFRTAINENEKYYLLGYARDPKKDKPGWRKLQVKLDKPDVEVRARTGYMVPGAKLDDKRTRQIDLLTAIASPLDFTGVPIFAKWKGAPQPTKDGKQHLVFQLWLPADPAFKDESKFNMDIIALADDHSGKRQDSFQQVIGPKLPAEAIKQIRERGISYDGDLTLPKGDFTVKLVVRDNISGKLGSLTWPVKVD